MAKLSAIEKNKRRARLVNKYAARRARMLAIDRDVSLPQEERFAARLKLAALPRNSAAVRGRSRCKITGRPRGYDRKFAMSRIALRELASSGMLPGVVKSSW